MSTERDRYVVVDIDPLKFAVDGLTGERGPIGLPRCCICLEPLTGDSRVETHDYHDACYEKAMEESPRRGDDPTDYKDGWD